MRWSKEKVTEIDVQAVTRNCVFFIGEEERLTGVSFLSSEFNSPLAFVSLKGGGILE
jgi:hypothetical protein